MKSDYLRKSMSVIISLAVASGMAAISATTVSALEGDKETEDPLPSKVDLRDYNGMNYVTPVKFQNPFGTCWAFSIAAAAETCYLFQNGLGVPAGEINNNIDLSEKYINWFYYHHITELDAANGDPYIASQLGEGYYVDEAEEKNINAVYDFGGFATRGQNILMAGMGLVDESFDIDEDYPFAYRGVNSWRSNNHDEDEEIAELRRNYYYMRYKDEIDALIEKGNITSADEFDDWFSENWQPGKEAYDNSFKYGCYAPFDDWSIPDGSDYYLPGTLAYLKYSIDVDIPAGKNEDGEYEFDQDALDNMKKLIASGHALTLSFRADNSLPDDELGEDCTINFEHWAQYYAGPEPSNHGVTVIGYDDNFPKEYFTRTYKGEVVEDSTPPGDGAFIIKNSWGHSDCDEDDPNHSSWGYEDSGYFYLSYYDHSISSSGTYEFYTDEETPYRDLYFEQYNFLFDSDYSAATYDHPIKNANVFTAKEDSFLTRLAAYIYYWYNDVHYEIYKDPEDGDPSSGVLLESGDIFPEYQGYLSFDLKHNYFIEKGQKYSVVISYVFTYTDDDNEEKHLYNLIFPYLTNFSADKGITVKAVINPGESYVYLGDETQAWIDYSEYSQILQEVLFLNFKNDLSEEELNDFLKNGIDDIVLDNLPIKAMLIPADEYTCEHGELIRIEATDPTADTDGNIEYFICPYCGKWFTTEDGDEEIIDHDSVIIPATGETPEQPEQPEQTDPSEPSDSPGQNDPSEKDDDTSDKPSDSDDKPQKPSINPTDSTTQSTQSGSNAGSGSAEYVPETGETNIFVVISGFMLLLSGFIIVISARKKNEE